MNIQKGKARKAPRLLVYGIEGIGKSTFASQSPNPVFVQTEDGLDEIDCHRFDLVTQFSEVAKGLQWLTDNDHDRGTVVIDSLDWLERLIWREICQARGVKNIEDIGYAKGYTFALDCWGAVLRQLDALRARGLAVILIAHAKIEKFEDPELETYDRFSPRLHKHATALVTEWADAVLFACRKTFVKSSDEGFGKQKHRAVTTDDRILRCVGSPGCVAKNRYGLPAEIPLSWDSFIQSLPPA